MKFKLALVTLITVPLLLTACAKKEDASTAQQDQNTSTTEAVATTEKVSPEQQAAIDSIDKPVMDEKNTDVPESVSSAPADAATEQK